ncbi:response regulator transcription factor [Nocardioides sp. R-C-SC26]|uniref:response regulator transcription factor n=1 Tax=Nocardioides sp. R-C-SC26 TaxID=2870414 RepID=UPI001E46CDA1|nr:response regulator transcription factor [Nocardioides sp. R-C-SC26]
MPTSGTPLRRGFYRVAIVEDHALQRERTEEVLHERAGVRVVARCEHLPQFVAWLERAPREERPHLLVLDLSVDRGPAVDPELVASLVRGGLRVLVLSAMASPALVRQVMRAGVAGFVGKRDPATDLVDAVHTVLSGGEWMTPDMANVIVNDPGRPALSDQEERALVLYASGLTLEAVAAGIGVKRDTAKKYIDVVKRKYAEAGRSVRSKTDLYRAAVADGYLDDAR